MHNMPLRLLLWWFRLWRLDSAKCHFRDVAMDPTTPLAEVAKS